MLPNSLSLPLTMFTALANRTDLLMALTDRTGRLEWINQAFAERTGLAIEQLLGQKFFCVLASNSQIDVQQAHIREQLLKGESFKFELYYVSPHQSEYWLLVDGQPIHDEEGIATKYAVLATDITLRKRTEQDLEQTRQRLLRLVESVKLVPWEAQAVTHQFTYVGPQVTHLFGYEQQHWYEPNFWHSHVHPEDLPQVLEHHQALLQKQDDYIVEYRLLTIDGQWIWVKDIVTVVRHQGKVTHLLGFLIDINERKQTELSLQKALKALETVNEELEMRVLQRTVALSREKEKLEQALQQLQKAQAQLIQSEKMSSLGQLVAGVAHEINNPISFIYGNLSYATEYTQNLLHILQCYQQQYPNPTPALQAEIEAADLDYIMEDLPKLLSSMRVGAERIAEIVLSLRTFSHSDKAEMKQVNIHEGIDSTLMILQHRLKAKPEYAEIQVIKEYGKLPKVDCYPGQLNQVLMNIIVNAIDALEERDCKRSPQDIKDHPSKITIRTEIRNKEQEIQIQEERYLKSSTQNPVAEIVIRIIDNGRGISEAVKSRLFDPFFTTKPIGKGTGLGLSISYQIIVERHQGKLECYSTLDKGTEFVIIIPLRQTNKVSCSGL